jgi:hypothetical protein
MAPEGVDDLVTCRMHFRVVPFLFESKDRLKPALAELSSPCAHDIFPERRRHLDQRGSTIVAQVCIGANQVKCLDRRDSSSWAT